MIAFGFYLAFSVGVLIAYLAVPHILGRQSTRKPSEPLLTDDRRQQLEAATLESLQLAIRRDPDLCDKLLTYYWGESRRAIESSASVSYANKLMVPAVGQLTDHALITLMQKLAVLHRHQAQDALDFPPRQAQRLTLQRLGHWGGFLALVFLLLFPPWVEQQERWGGTFEEGETQTIMQRTAIGHHWLGHRFPSDVVEQVPTYDLQRYERHWRGIRLNLPRLIAEVILVWAGALFISSKPISRFAREISLRWRSNWDVRKRSTTKPSWSSFDS